MGGTGRPAIDGSYRLVFVPHTCLDAAKLPLKSTNVITLGGVYRISEEWGGGGRLMRGEMGEVILDRFISV